MNFFEIPIILLINLSIINKIVFQTSLSHEISLAVDLAVNGFHCQWNLIDNGIGCQRLRRQRYTLSCYCGC